MKVLILILTIFGILTGSILCWYFLDGLTAIIVQIAWLAVCLFFEINLLNMY